jgi:hypothetical protein
VFESWLRHYIRYSAPDGDAFPPLRNLTAESGPMQKKKPQVSRATSSGGLSYKRISEPRPARRRRYVNRTARTQPTFFNLQAPLALGRRVAHPKKQKTAGRRERKFASRKKLRIRQQAGENILRRAGFNHVDVRLDKREADLRLLAVAMANTSTKR